MDKYYVYKYDIFVEFIKDVQFCFQYVDDLLDFSQVEEAKYFITNIIKPFLEYRSEYRREFIRYSSPYYLLMVLGAISLKKNVTDIIDMYFTFKYYSEGGNTFLFMDRISWGEDGWRTISKEVYKKDYYNPMYSICSEHLIPEEFISLEDYNRIDAYITFQSIFVPKIDRWFLGCSIFGNRALLQIYQDYFEDKLANNDEVRKFLQALIDNYVNRFSYNIHRGLNSFIQTIAAKIDEEG